MMTMMIFTVLVVRIIIRIVILMVLCGQDNDDDYDFDGTCCIFTCQHIVAFQLPAPRTPGSENINLLEVDNMQLMHH